MNTFAVIDVETANANMSSICQIGIAFYEEGKLSQEWKSYINPNDYFDGMNVSIHGIDETTVKNAPDLISVSNQLLLFLDNKITICHTKFDQTAIKQAFNKYKLRQPNCTWLDSAKIARRTWMEIAYKGYGLKNLCKMLNYKFKHHDALEDAKAAGYIIVSAINKTGLNISDWIDRVKKPLDFEKNGNRETIHRDGNPEGFLYGEILAFTGALEIPRRQAADMAATIGCQVSSGVTKKTSVLVVGDQDISRLAGHTKSSKHLKAEKLISEGQEIRIIGETDFMTMVQLQD